MVTDPVQRIRATEHATPMALDLAKTLDRLANAPPSTDASYLTVTLDWRPEGSEPGRIPAPEPKRSERRSRAADESAPRRPSWDTLRRELEEAIAGYGPRGAAFESLTADLERTGQYLEEDLDPAAQGVVVVACNARNVFESIPLSIPVATGYTIGPIPSLLELIHAGHDFPPYAVLLADQRDAFLWIMERQTWARGVQLEADSYPRKTQQGGWSQRRYQNRADERVDAFARTIADETRRELVEGNAHALYLIVAADEVMSSALDAAFHESVKGRVLGLVRLPIDASMDDIAAAAEPLVEQRERQHERDAVQAVSDGAGAGGRGVAGSEDTLIALETGQVMTLVVNDDFDAPAWADFTFPVYGVGDPPAEHPAAGDVANIVPIRLMDLAVRLAIQTGADVELVATAVPVAEEEQIPDADQPIPRSRAARALDAMGGIGAVLRFALDEGQPTADR